MTKQMGGKNQKVDVFQQAMVSEAARRIRNPNTYADQIFNPKKVYERKTVLDDFTDQFGQKDRYYKNRPGLF